MAGQPRQTSIPGRLRVTYVTKYHHDRAGCLDAITYPSGAKLVATCDSNNRVKTLTVDGGGVVVKDVTYEPSGQVRTITYGNGIKTSFGYDARGRTTSISAPDTLQLSYSYDGANNVVRIASFAPYSWSSLGRAEGGPGCDWRPSVQRAGLRRGHRVPRLRGEVVLAGERQFISADSYLGDPANPASLNRYSYVHNNPYKYVDPSGHAPAIPLWLAKFIAGSEALWAEAAVAARSVTAGGAIGLLIMPVHTAHEGDEYLGNLTFTVRNADGSLTADTSREGRREAMRQAGIPTSQQPESQSQDDAGRTYGYQVPAPGGGTLGVSVQQQPMDRSHPGQEHWEAGKVKTDSQGNARVNKHGRPQLQNDKAKVDVRENHR